MLEIRHALRIESLAGFGFADCRILPAILLLALLALPLTACTPAPKPELRIGTNIWPGYEPLYLARSLGLLKGTGISLIEYPSSTETMRALRHGGIEAGALTLDEVLTLAQDGIDLRIVLLLDVSDGADAVIARPGIESMEDLRGRTIGAESSALGGYMLSRVLDKAGLKQEDVHIIPLMLDEHEQAFIENRVDAVVTFEPVKSRLLEQGGKIVFDSSMIPGEVVDVLVVRAAILADHPESLNTLAELWFHALDYVQREPADAARRMQARLRLPADRVLEQFAGVHMGDRRENDAFFDDAASASVKNATLMMQVMRRQQLLRRDVDVNRLFAGHASYKSTGTTP